MFGFKLYACLRVDSPLVCTVKDLSALFLDIFILFDLINFMGCAFIVLTPKNLFYFCVYHHFDNPYFDVSGRILGISLHFFSQQN